MKMFFSKGNHLFQVSKQHCVYTEFITSIRDLALVSLMRFFHWCPLPNAGYIKSISFYLFIVLDQEEQEEEQKLFNERAYLAGRIPLVKGGDVDPKMLESESFDWPRDAVLKFRGSGCSTAWI